MKKFIVLIACVFGIYHSYAADIVINTLQGSTFTAIINGNVFESRSDQLAITNLKGGKYDITVIEYNRRGQKTVKQGRVNIASNSIVYITTNNFNGFFVEEQILPLHHQPTYRKGYVEYSYRPQTTQVKRVATPVAKSTPRNSYTALQPYKRR